MVFLRGLLADRKIIPLIHQVVLDKDDLGENGHQNGADDHRDQKRR